MQTSAVRRAACEYCLVPRRPSCSHYPIFPSLWNGSLVLLGGHVGLRDIRKALAALARELNDSEAKRLQIEDALRSAGGGVGISEVGAYKPMYVEGATALLAVVSSCYRCCRCRNALGVCFTARSRPRSSRPSMPFTSPLRSTHLYCGVNIHGAFADKNRRGCGSLGGCVASRQTPVSRRRDLDTLGLELSCIVYIYTTDHRTNASAPHPAPTARGVRRCVAATGGAARGGSGGETCCGC